MNETTSLVRTPTEQLAHILEPVPATMAARVSGTLAPFFAHLDEWEKERAMLHVTDESQVGKMKRAKVLRLEIRTARVAIEKACDSLKEDALREQRVVNAVLRLAQSLIEPLESSLKQDETFAERAETGRQRLRAEADAARVTAEALAVAAREEADAAHRAAEGERDERIRLSQEDERRRMLAGERGRFLVIANALRSMAQTLDVIDEEAIQTKAGKVLGVKVRKRLMEVAADIEGAADRLATGEAS